MSSDGGKKQFWKRNTAKVPGSIQHVYGAQHPPFDPLLHANLIKAGNKPASTSAPGKPKKATTFQEFENITSDAWDVGDDDDELLAMAARNLNIEVVMETANKVIENHSKLRERRQRRRDQALEPEEKEEEEGRDDDEDEREEEEEAAETTAEMSFSFERLPHGDSRLVKSHSEGPIGSPKALAGERGALHRQQSLPHRPPVIPLVARMADQNTSGTPAMTEREASRLDKFRQLLAGPNTDLGWFDLTFPLGWNATLGAHDDDV
ncbi:TBC1 domain family member 22A-like [Brachyhypopomus gauderio]|uniref:TBC1 domain family member 22A-like n=1 Tax=Brachyhypopomus gauderio TaxID=698409 RepID=UPI0040428747